VTSCPSCAKELPDDARFCLHCGTPIEAQRSPAEYKQVTVLFADVVRSMDIAAAVGAERLREIMTELLDRSTTVVKRYGGTVNQFTGDGIMAVFGAPMALEDHAFRAGLSARAIQTTAETVASEVKRRDGVEFRLRVGLNSGQVIAGEVGSSPLGYTAIGEQVGMAQRMESVAPPGGVMLSESTARLVENAAVLGDPELVKIKGADGPCVPTATGHRRTHRPLRRTESALVDAVGNQHDHCDPRRGDQRGCVVTVVGPPGIGKSRLVREAAAIAADRGVAVITTYCESHTRDIPFHAVARLLRAGMGLNDLDAIAARNHLRDQFQEADPDDLVLLEDLLGIRDTATGLPDVAPMQAATTDRADHVRRAGPAGPHGVRHRGRALDRRSERIDARRLSRGGPQDPGLDADHLQA
jgi:adenylate cyclase